MARPLKLTETVKNAEGSAAEASTLKVGEIGLTSQTGNQIQVSAYIPTADGGSSAVNGSLIKQVSGRRFKVTTAQGTGICKLVATAPAAGEMRLTATDSDSNTYYVTKITKHRVQLTQNTGSQFATGASASWGFSGPVSGSKVTIASA